jgi:sugar/nucleoside kinase (ribokinase family)
MTLDLLVLGDCNPDLVLSGGSVEPAFGQVERLVERAQLEIGGSGTITACGAARLGLRVGLVAIIGDDPFGRFMLEALRERSVDTSRLIVDSSRPTGVSVVLVRGQDRAILTALGGINALSAERVGRERLGSARHVHVSSLFLQRDLRPGLGALLAEARAAGATTSIDPNWDSYDEWNGDLLDVLAVTDALFVNGEEARRIARVAEAEEAARVLGRRGPTVVVKLGSDGAIAYRNGEVVRVAAPRVQVVDTIGAGDSFDAGFISGCLRGHSLVQSLTLAVACGSLSTRAVGGTTAQPTLDEATTV